MRQETWGSLNVCVTGGTDREGGGDGPVVVLLHGFGAPGTDLVALWRVLDVPDEVRFVFPAAPLQLPAEFGAGRAWWMLDMERIQRAMLEGTPRDLSSEEPEGLPAAREQVLGMLDAMQSALTVSSERIVLGGFSQGAMLSCDIALEAGRDFAGLVQLSGTLLSSRRWTPKMVNLSLPIFQSHGEQDAILAFEGGKRLHHALTEAGCRVEWVPFRGGHEIPMRVLEALGGFLTQALDG